MYMKIIVSLLIKDDDFSFQTGYNNKNTEFIDLFYYRTTDIILGIPIDEYLQTVEGSWLAV